MANVLISHFSPIKVGDRYEATAYHEGLIEALLRNGNNVAHIISSDYLRFAWNGSNSDLFDDIDKEKLIAAIQAFNPDVCIAYNNSIPDMVVESVSCPVVLGYADSLKYFNDSLKIKENKSRYKYLCSFDHDVEEIHEFLGRDVEVIKLPVATAVISENLIKSSNVSFIGTAFSTHYNFIDVLKSEKLDEYKNIFSKIKNNIIVDRNDPELLGLLDRIPEGYLFASFSGEVRFLILTLLSDLGLALYGGDDWFDVGRYLPSLALSYKPQRVFSLEDNQRIYNSSKICINISHAQAKDGFPWRVFDIMASSGCLVSDRKSGLVELTKEYVDIPMYYTPIEAYELCKKLLKDDIWRKEVISGSQKFISERGRWEHRFDDLSSILQVSLLNKDKVRGTYLRLLPEFIQVPELIQVPDVVIENLSSEACVLSGVMESSISDIENSDIEIKCAQPSKGIAYRVARKIKRGLLKLTS